MTQLLYRASFYLYELSYLIFAAALCLHAINLRRINQALRQPAYWLWPLLGGLLLLFCAFNHFYVYHYMSPQYLVNESRELLILMYIYKTIAMVCTLVAGLALVFSQYFYFKRISH